MSTAHVNSIIRRLRQLAAIGWARLSVTFTFTFVFIFTHNLALLNVIFIIQFILNNNISTSILQPPSVSFLYLLGRSTIAFVSDDSSDPSTSGIGSMPE
jgi:hypothetical protein